MKHNELPLTLDLWRLSIIGELLHRHPDDGRTLTARLSEMSGKTWIRPDGTPCQFSAETLRKWYARFRAGGAAALRDRRPSRGTLIPQRLGEALIELRGCHPSWSVKLLLDDLGKRGIWNHRCPSKASLYRWCRAKGLLRSKKTDPLDAMAFEFTAFGALWLSDVLHGPKVTLRGRKRKTYLLAIIDDASRFIVSARFHLSEGIEPLITDLRQALLRFGLPQRFYTDNGACYRSRILHQIGARLDIAMPHTPPYQPQGRGKVERWFRTVREGFLAQNTAKTLDQLNRDFQKWVVTYHQTPHRGISGETPLDKRLRIETLCRQMPETTNIDALFTQSRRVRLTKDKTFRLQNRIFEAPKAKHGNRLEIFFQPWDLTTVFYGPERWPARILDKHGNARRFEHAHIKQENNHA